MSDIPSDLHREILLRLPAESLLRFRSVCKWWCRTIDDPSFVKSHALAANKQRPSSSLLFISNDTLYYLSLDSLNYINGKQTIHATQCKTLFCQGVPRLPEFPVASCNGLILFSYDNASKWVVWNPLTGDFRELPQFDDTTVFSVGRGIGYDSASDDYKVVMIDHAPRDGYRTKDYWFLIDDSGYYRTLVYSLRLNSWKKIEDGPSDFGVRTGNEKGVFLNGAIHWRTARGSVIVLDLATEKYQEPLSSGLHLDRLDAFDRCLVLTAGGAFGVRDFGFKEEPIWVKLFSYEERRYFWSSVWPVACSKSERHFILMHKKKILRWDIDKCSLKNVVIDGLLQGSPFVPGGLFRFNGSGVGKWKEKGKRIEASKRLMLLATTTDDALRRLSDLD